MTTHWERLPQRNMLLSNFNQSDGVPVQTMTDAAMASPSFRGGGDQTDEKSMIKRGKVALDGLKRCDSKSTRNTRRRNPPLAKMVPFSLSNPLFPP